MSAAGALCNLGLDFSSVKEAVVSNGALESLVCHAPLQMLYRAVCVIQIPRSLITSLTRSGGPLSTPHALTTRYQISQHKSIVPSLIDRLLFH
jgi:hypothetical protein